MTSKKPAKKESKSDYEVLSENLKGYKDLLGEIKKKVKSAQLKAAVAVNKELIQLYWDIGNSVLEKQETEGWGSKVIERLAKDLRSSFPNMKGFSPRNIQYMVTFAREYPKTPITQQPVAQIPWGHNTLLMDKINNSSLRLWYANKTIENGWSRSVLMHWIDTAYTRGKGRLSQTSTVPSPLLNQTLPMKP